MTFRSALFVAHPGHELRLHHWLEVERPIVYVLTDGSGHGERSRTDESRELLARCGATAGPIFGRFTDRELYAMLLRGEVAPIADTVRELARELSEHGVQTVAGDAWELYNPAHDLCRVMLDLAAGSIPNYEVAIVREAPGGDVTLTLDDEALARKLAAARAYQSMRAEAEGVLEREGVQAFRVETLRRATRPRAPELVADYELFGADRVAAGHYGTVIRYREHFAPFVAQLAEVLQPAVA
ncbi:MAG TPA: hypothetical protein VGR02_08170 [Thermoanaerobaculia bacterium]|jgi:hypothetical protein|nr:hypothetical protein [Thermoanaerobaculia bacterium]